MTPSSYFPCEAGASPVHTTPVHQGRQLHCTFLVSDRPRTPGTPCLRSRSNASRHRQKLPTHLSETSKQNRQQALHCLTYRYNLSFTSTSYREAFKLEKFEFRRLSEDSSGNLQHFKTREIEAIHIRRGHHHAPSEEPTSGTLLTKDGLEVGLIATPWVISLPCVNLLPSSLFPYLPNSLARSITVPNIPCQCAAKGNYLVASRRSNGGGRRPTSFQRNVLFELLS
jgi:hypothetical protein